MKSITFFGPALALLLVASAAAQTSAPDSGKPAFAKPVEMTALASYRGGAQVHNDMTLAGTTADNTAMHITTGNNTIGSGSFANMNGMPMVVQNSGANVLIQNALIVNMQMN